MKYSEILNNIEKISLNHGLVDSFKIGDNILQEDNNEYPMIYITPQKVIVGNPMNTYSFTMFYVDRGNNNKFIIDNAIRALSDITRELDLEHGIDIEKSDFTIFNHKFNDSCCGIFCDLSVKTFTEYNEDNKIIKNELS